MATDDLLDAGREAHSRREWGDAYDALTEADRAARLAPGDLLLLAEAARWTRRFKGALSTLERAAAALETQGDLRGAAGVSIELAEQHWVRGDDALAEAWMGRAGRLVEAVGDCPELGRVQLGAAYMLLRSGEREQALEVARSVVDTARRHGDRALEALGLVNAGHALIAGGSVQDGLALTDEASALALGDALDLETTGLVFCSTIFACRNGGDWRRAGEWADASLRYCERNELGWFPGLCRFHRSEVLRMHGDLDDAERAVREAIDDLMEGAPRHAPLGFAELGEIRRRRGDTRGAAAAFGRCAELGGQLGAGWALMLAAQGDHQGALAAVREALDGDVLVREPASLLAATVTIGLLADDTAAARHALAQLGELPGPAARAATATAAGELALCDGRATDAVLELRAGMARYFETRAPYEAARARMLLARALHACGSHAAAQIEDEASRATLARLGASFALEPGVADTGPGAGRALVTFMFTDIVGSTSLLDELGDSGWGDLLARHDAIVRAAFLEHRGREIKHEGDGFFVAFGEPASAVAAGCAIQRALAENRAADDSLPAVRVAIHTAPATARGGDFIGRGVHQAARLAAAAGGGEVLASLSTLEAAGDAFTATDRRELALKGFTDPLGAASVRWA